MIAERRKLEESVFSRSSVHLRGIGITNILFLKPSVVINFTLKSVQNKIVSRWQPAFIGDSQTFINLDYTRRFGRSCAARATNITKFVFNNTTIYFDDFYIIFCLHFVLHLFDIGVENDIYEMLINDYIFKN